MSPSKRAAHLLRWALIADDEYQRQHGDSWLGSLWRAQVGEWLADSEKPSPQAEVEK